MHLEVIGLLEDARTRYAEWARAQGLPFTTLANRVHVGPELHGRSGPRLLWCGECQLEILGEWRIDPDWSSAAFLLAAQAASVSTDPPCSERGYSSFAAELLGLKPEVFRYHDDPPRWLVENILVPASVHYIKSLPTAESGDEAAAAAIATEIVEQLSGGRQGTRLTIAVAGVETTGVISADGLTLRPLSGTERGELLSQTTGQYQGSLPPLAATYLKGDLPTHLLQADEWHPNDVEHPAAASLYPPMLLAAFALHGFWLAGIGASALTMLPEWRVLGLGSGPLAMAPWATSTRSIAESDLPRVATTLNKLRRFDLREPRNSQDLALHRFSLGCNRDNAVDGLLDLVIALESLLLPYDEDARHGDLSFRFRLHGALWIEGNGVPAVPTEAAQ